MAVRVARQDRVERRHPGVEIDVELTAERVVAAERRLGDLGEDRLSRAADQMRRGRPSNDLPARRVSAPAHLPLADVLDAVRRRSGADDVVADGGAEARRRISRTVRFDGGDEELRDGDVTQIVESAAAVPRRTRERRASRSPRQIRSPAAPRAPPDSCARSVGRQQSRAAETRDRAAPLVTSATRAAPREALRTTRRAARRAPSPDAPAGTHRPRFELLQERLHRFGNRELGAIVRWLACAVPDDASASEQRRQ